MIKDLFITLWVIAGVYFSSRIIVSEEIALELYMILLLVLAIITIPVAIGFVFYLIDPRTASATRALLRLLPCHRTYPSSKKLKCQVFPASLT